MNKEFKYQTIHKIEERIYSSCIKFLFAFGVVPTASSFSMADL